jgi:hypothetical protein
MTLLLRWHGGCGRLVVHRWWIILTLLIAPLIRIQGAVTEFPFESREGLLWVQVRSALTEEKLNFLLDSGASVTTLNLAAAKRLGLKLGRKVSVQGVGASLKGYWQQNVALRAGDVPLPRRCLTVDLNKLSCSCEHPVDGLIGADFFRDRIVEIDFVSSKIRMVNAPNTSDERLPLEVRSCGFRVPISVNGLVGQLVRLDTGCATPLQWVTSRVPDGCGKKVAIGLTEVSIPQTTTTVTLGRFSFEEVPTGLHKKPLFAGEAGLLGVGLLSHFSVVTIDARQGELWLRNSAK